MKFALACFLILLPHCLDAWFHPVCIQPSLPQGAMTNAPDTASLEANPLFQEKSPENSPATLSESIGQIGVLHHAVDYAKRQNPLPNNVCMETCGWKKLTTAVTLSGQTVEIYQPEGSIGQWFYECKCRYKNRPCTDGSNAWESTRCVDHFTSHSAFYRICVSNNCGGQRCYYQVGFVKTKSGCCCRLIETQ